MLPKPTSSAFALSIIINAACVAALGGSALVHPRAVPAQKPPLDKTERLHPVQIRFKQAKPTDGADKQNGGGSDKSARESSNKSKSRLPVEDASSGSGANPVNSLSPKPQLSSSISTYFYPTAPQNAREASLNTPESPLGQKNQSSKLSPGEHRDAARPQPASALRTSDQARQALLPLESKKQSEEIARAASSALAQSGAASAAKSRRGFKIGQYHSSVSWRLQKYAAANLNLGTIHETRPTQGVTGGGMSDMRNVNITAHYVIDDPGNVPKHLAPDRILHLMPTMKGSPDPGVHVKSLATGGNTSLGGYLLHGHDNITGEKYCVPGSGGIPSPTTGNPSQSPSDLDKYPTTGHGQIISQAYSGSDPGSAYLEKPQADPGSGQTGSTTAVHLPGEHADFRGLIPGAAVPKEDRRWVSNPLAHLDDAPLGARSASTMRFTLAPRSVGSLDARGTIDWGRPEPIKRKKAPAGGDGTGLLGEYYLGNNFDRLMFTRPDRNIDYDWTGTGPDPRMPMQAFSVRWLGQLIPPTSDTYTLMTDSDDGVRVYLDGHLIISDWNIHAAREDTANVTLNAGQRYNLKVEYFEKNGESGEVVQLYWQSSTQPREYIPEQDLKYPLNAASAAAK